MAEGVKRWPTPEGAPVEVTKMKWNTVDRWVTSFYIFFWHNADNKKMQLQVALGRAGTKERAEQMLTECRDFVAAGGSKAQAEAFKARLLNNELEPLPLPEKEEPPPISAIDAELIAMGDAPPEHVSHQLVVFGHHGKECHFGSRWSGHDTYV
jgi:hypothetical protein